MRSNENHILVINGGSSSIKFALYHAGDSLFQFLGGEVENIGSNNARLNVIDSITNKKNSIRVDAKLYKNAANFLIDWIEKEADFDSIKAIGHRIVNGLNHNNPEKITPGLLNELKKMSAYDPAHLPEEINLIEIFQKCYPALVQIACFDTSFHVSMPTVAKWIPIPRKYFSMGIQRYGFHGLSYSFLMEKLAELQGDKIDKEKMILAHLGNGASLAAIKNGKS